MKIKPSIIKYLLIDSNRVIIGGRIVVAIIGVLFSLFFSLEGQIDSKLSVFEAFQYATIASGFMLTFLFCAYPYAGSLVEDFEKKYMYYQMMRGSVIKYVISKVVVIMLTSILVMAIGCCLFSLLYSAIGPWKEQSWSYEQNNEILFGYILKCDLDFLWYFFYGIQRGIYAGLLSLGAAFLSLYLSNKMFVLIIPVLLNQILVEISSLGNGGMSLLDPIMIFNSTFSSGGNHFMSFLWSILIGIISMCILGCLIIKRIKVLL